MTRRFLAIAFSLCTLSCAAAESVQFTEPFFQTGVPHPTQDKPQSKLWYAHDRFWAWLPTKDGSTVLERTASGWQELIHLKSFLTGFPGQADVWSDDDTVRAALVGDDRLAVIELTFDQAKNTYIPGEFRHQFPLPSIENVDRLETATIARDSGGRWWIAYDRDQTIFVNWTTDQSGRNWNGFRSLGERTHRDDICAIFALPDRIGVLWSDQVADAVYFQEHFDEQSPQTWSGLITVQRGGKTADDHLNGTVAPDGTLYVATKNSVDQIGAPQQVLRIRHPDGDWTNHPYAILQERLAPSRPIVQLLGPSQDLYLVHTNYDRRDPVARRDYIAGIKVARNASDIARPEFRILSATKPLNNVTGTKRPLPIDVHGLILASDAEGGVYEATIPNDSMR